MSKYDDYRQTLQTLSNWDEFIIAHSGLPGPRGNLELVQAAAAVGQRPYFEHCLTFDPEQAPTNSPQVVLVMCGILGLGWLVRNGDATVLPTLRAYASDPRWRVREAVAMALQTIGDGDRMQWLAIAEEWSRGGYYEQRAAIAGLCEPRLLNDPAIVLRVLDVLDEVTAAVVSAPDRKDEGFQALRKALAYCWSVAVAALPDQGRRYMERWLDCSDRDVRWIMRENLGKKRLAKFDPAWVAQARVRLTSTVSGDSTDE